MPRQNNSLFVKIKYFVVSESKQTKKKFLIFHFLMGNAAMFWGARLWKAALLPVSVLLGTWVKSVLAIKKQASRLKQSGQQ